MAPFAVAVELRLTGNGDFREIFDSGLRPKMLDGRSNQSCYVKNFPVALKIENHVYPEVEAERVSINVLKNHLMIEITIHTKQKMTIQEARKLAMAWGVDEDILRVANLENFAWRLVPKNDKWRASAGFVSSYNEEKPLLFRIWINWKRSFKELEMHQGLLPPPPGYEHISMEEESTDPWKALKPNATLENSIAHNRSEKPRPKTSDDLINANPKKSDPFPWWLIASSIGLLVIAIVAWLKLRNSKSSP